MTSRPNIPFLPTLAIIAGAVALIMWPIKNYIEKRAYKEARSYAVQRFGDKQEPLTGLEQARWYKFMGVEEGKKYSLKQLRHYNDSERSASRLENVE